MNIFIMRHGEAELFAHFDSERNLTPLGAEQALRQGQRLAAANIHFDRVLVSPYLRAQQTFVQVNLAFDNQLISRQETWKALTPDGSDVLVRDYLRLLAAQGHHNILIISHLPLVGEIAAILCNGRTPIHFYTSTIGQISWDGKQGSVEEIYYPNELSL